MNFEAFIAKRILSGNGNKISKPIVNITVAAIAVGIALMIMSLVVLKGFQKEIRNKVVGFGSHIQILPAGQSYSKESSRVLIDQSFYPEITKEDGVRHIQLFAIKPGILETKDNIQGVAIKGIAGDFDWDFFQDKIVAGERLELNQEKASTEIMISKYIANRLNLELGDKVTVYFVQNSEDIRPRPFRIKCIYNTGLEEFDKKYVFVDLKHIQKIANWGLQAQMMVKKVGNDSAMVEALTYGGDKKHIVDWEGIKLRNEGPHIINIHDNPNFHFVLNDQSGTIADTAWVDFTATNDSVSFLVSTSGGSQGNYAGGFEILLDNYEKLFDMDDKIYRKNDFPFNLQTQNIVQQNQEIFNWLNMLDVNVYIITGLMIFISIINMTSAILIIILEKTRTIGVLKAFGAVNSSIVKIFVRTSLQIIGKGVIYGNIIGLGFALLQQYTGFISLEPANYFVDRVPIHINWLNIVSLNLGTVIICAIFLIIPALYVSKISPVKAIRFD